MNSVDWQTLSGKALSSEFLIGEFLQASAGGAFFRASRVNSQREFLLRLEDGGQTSAAPMLNRFREAHFLQNAGVVKVEAVGQLACDSGDLIYLITEMAEADLAEVLQLRTLKLEEVANLVRQVASSLKYIHSENLVYCALRAGSVWRVGTEWKLADFTQLRVVGKYPVQETRRLLLTPSYDSPPEANEGVVSEAWDIWSLGSMVRKLLLRQLEAEGSSAHPNRLAALNNVAIPAPFNQLLRECLEPNPTDRATPDRILELLSSSDSGPATESVAPSRPLVADRTPTHPEPAVATETSRPSLWRQRARSVPAVLGVLAASVLFGALLFTSKNFEHPVQANSTVASRTAPEGPKPGIESKPDPFGGSPDAGPDHARPQQAISHLVEKWAEATRNHNVEQEVNCYAPMVDKFYGQRQVTAARLRAEEKDVFSRIGTVRKFEISNLKFNRVEPQWAVVSFDKTWDFGNRSRFAGSARDELVLRTIRGEWKIASQREMKLYWVNKGPVNSDQEPNSFASSSSTPSGGER